MRPSLLFIVPAHGRVELSKICLAQLRATCDAIQKDLDASAIVIADDENLDIAHANGFWGYEQDNRFLGRKFNDGYEFAGRYGFDYCVPLGSDDWIHPSLFAGERMMYKIQCARRLVMIQENGHRYIKLSINYEGGVGMRIIPTWLLKVMGYRPSSEDRKRGVDTSTLMRLKSRHHNLQLEYYDTPSHWQIVDFKTEDNNLNTFGMCLPYAEGAVEKDPWPSLYEWYPEGLVSQMQQLYGIQKELRY